MREGSHNRRRVHSSFAQAWDDKCGGGLYWAGDKVWSCIRRNGLMSIRLLRLLLVVVLRLRLQLAAAGGGGRGRGGGGRGGGGAGSGGGGGGPSLLS